MTVEVGTPAPDFTLRDQDGQDVTLSSFRGNKNVVVLFYPLTFTNVCRGELCAVRDELATFQNDNVQVLAISVDSPQAHRVWAEQQGYTFPLLSDFWPHGATAQAYGVFNDAMGVALRGTFVIDKQGVVRWTVVNAIPDARDQQAYAKVLADLS
ncbi:MAG TPA: peroxiredoxin [Mycobacteriales bacterium]|jgi:peroxiredoxin|nr:peroxiredoxin [Mycobacteriales bacterium]